MFHMKLIRNYILLSTLILVGNLQIYQYESPCPRTFMYETDRNGDLYGTIGVYSFEENIELNVELSVGNQVQNYNGQIDLAIPREEVISAVRNRRPIKYRVTFPRWQNVPPKVTRITVNGDEVCTGPPLPLNGWFSVITTVNLQHRFRRIEPLSAPGSPNIDNQVIGNNQRREPSGTKFYGNPFLTTRPNRKPVSNVYYPDSDKDEIDVEILSLLFTTTTPRSTTRSTTTRNTEKNILVNDLLFSDNPFLNGRATARPVTQSTPKTPLRSHTNRPQVFTNRPRSSTRRPQSISCGNPVVANPLIINGKSVPKGAFPWLIAMFRSTGIGVEYKCAGSLVSSKHIITAAHCVTDSRTKRQISPDKFLFVLGKLNIENLLIRDGEKMVGAEDIKVHPDYVPLNSDADIAVVILSEIIHFTNFIRPICLWSESDDIDEIVGENGKVVGWGKDERNNAMTTEPKQTTISVVSQEQCLRSSELFKYITSPRTFCAGNRNYTGPCNGDSGSGFVMDRRDRWFLKGVVSLSSYDSVKQSCDLTNYVVFTDVSKFKDWLSSIISF